jgi:two-component sensor histidine kinase/ligand-binding sensor domain-containing protein
MRYKLKSIFCLSSLLALFGFYSNLFGQAYDFRSYTVSDGLPHGQISDLHQSHDGFMWIGTAASGLVRFDGHTYRIYDITHGLRDDVVNLIYEDSKRRLWVATYEGGIAYLEGDSLIYPFRDHLIHEAYLTSITEDITGKIWFGTYDLGVLIYDGEQFEQLSTDQGLLDNTVWDVYWHEDGSIWIATHLGFSIYKDGIFENFTEADGISGTKVFKFIDGPDNDIWMATSNGITIFENGKFRTITEISGRQLNYIFDILKSSDGKIWIGTENDGLYWYEKERFTHISRTEGLVSNYIHKLYEDKDGNVWVATDENGISIYRGETFKFYNASNGLISNEVLSLHKDKDGKIWIGTTRGLQSFDGNSFSSYQIPLDEGDLHEVWNIDQLSNGNILLTVDYRIFEYDGNRFRDVTSRLNMVDRHILDIYVDSKGSLWIATDEGLFYQNGNNFRHFTVEDGLPGSIIYHIYESLSNEIWLATSQGLSRFGENGFYNIRYSDGLGHYNVNYITQDKFGDFWVGTSAGVSYLKSQPDGSLQVITNFGRSDGMKLVETLFLYFDEDDHLWQGTNGGIHHLDVAKYRESGQLEVEHFRLSRFGIGVETMHKATTTDRYGLTWFGTMQGLILLDTQKFDKRTISAPVTYIDRVQFNGTDINHDNLHERVKVVNADQSIPSVQFPYGNNSYTFSFKGIEFLTPENVQYRYMLVGFDENWNISTNSNSATYTNLDAGNYSLLVASRVGAGPWSVEPAIYNFSISYPYWQRVWFWAIILLILGVSIFGFIHIRLEYLEKIKLSRLVDEKTKHLLDVIEDKDVLLKEVHHRVKNNLSIIYGLLELQMDKISDQKTKDILVDSQLRIQSISLVHEKLYQQDNVSRIEAQKYIPELANMIIESLNDSRNIKLHLDIDDIDLTLDRGIPCGLIMNELISNAYKHAYTEATKGNLHIHFKRENGKIIMRVKDDGKGMPKAFDTENAQTLGLVLVEALTSQLKATFSIHSNGHGSTFDVVFKENGVA